MRLLILFAMLVMASPASAFMARNSLIVEARGADAFHVPYRGKPAIEEFWCAAGDYVIRELHLPPQTVIYRTSSPPRRAGQGISFNLSGEGATRSGLILLSGGRGISAAFARHLCNRPKILE